MINMVLWIGFIALICCIALIFILPLFYLMYEKINLKDKFIFKKIGSLDDKIKTISKFIGKTILYLIVFLTCSLIYKGCSAYNEKVEENKNECKNVAKILIEKKYNVYAFYVPSQSLSVRTIIENAKYKNIRSFYVGGEFTCIVFFTKNEIKDLQKNLIKISNDFIVKPKLVKIMINNQEIEYVLYESFLHNDLLKFKEDLKNEQF